MDLDERNAFLYIVCKEKRDYWRKRIDEIESDQDLYKIVQWHKFSPNIKALALNVDGKILWGNTEKAEARRKAFLETVTADEDLTDDPLEIPAVPRAQLPWQDHISPGEVAAAKINVKSISPGGHGISVRLINADWDCTKHISGDTFKPANRSSPNAFSNGESRYATQSE
ncbi:Fc.00g081090.m01.CDS01 [Cosmosporella sp. VM-42]